MQHPDAGHAMVRVIHRFRLHNGSIQVFRPQPKSWGPIELGCLSVCLSVIAFLYGLELLNGR